MNNNEIITENISVLQFNELKRTMQKMIEESIAALTFNDKLNYLDHLAYYEDCKMEDYFEGGFEKIYVGVNDVKVGEGLNTIAYKFVLNNNTRADFESAFEQARDDAFAATLKEISEEIEEIDDNEIEFIEIDDKFDEYELDEIERGCYTKDEAIGNRISIACENIEEQGGVRIALDSYNLLCFNIDLLQKIYDINGNLSSRQIAAWVGAKVCVFYQSNSEVFDYEYVFYL